MMNNVLQQYVRLYVYNYVYRVKVHVIFCSRVQGCFDEMKIFRLLHK